MRSDAQVRVDRPLLEEHLAALPPSGLALIAGSAGYGKSSAVASWCTKSGEPTRWLRAARDLHDALTLAVDEDEGIRLPRLARAMRRNADTGAGIAALLGDLGALGGGLTLVIDDADRLAGEAEGLATLRAIAERAPDRSRVILIGRRVAGLRLASARARRSVVEIGAQALRLSPLQARQIAEARGWRGAPTLLEELRRSAAGNGGVVAAWTTARAGDPEFEVHDFVRRDVVGGSAPTLRRLASREGAADIELLESLWSEGLLLAPASEDELGGEGWSLPHVIADALQLSPEPFSHITRGEKARRLERHRSATPAEPSQERVQVRDLGPIEILVGNVRLDGTQIRPRSLALLLFLATRPRHTATREEVIEALWPDAEPEGGVNSLNQAIYHLRRALDPAYDDRPTGEAAAYVRHESEVVSMHPELVSFDSAAALRGIDAIRRRASAEELDVILDLYRGPFGADLPFEGWATEHRDAIEVGIVAAVERAAIAAHDAGEIDRAIDIVGRAVRIDPANADLAESLAMLLAEVGAVAASRRAANRASGMLREVGVEPPLELVRLTRPVSDARRHEQR
jgi:DNA-binding SARP family transcriptional activator